MENLICLNDCNVQSHSKVLISNISWKMNKNEAWLIIGNNGSGKSEFLKAFAELGQISGNYKNYFEKSVEIVSLEKAASLIEEERKNDESEYIDGGVDKGRTGRFFLTEAILGHCLKKHEKLPDIAYTLDSNINVKLCGIEKILERGLKYMSTGQIRRTLLCAALLSKKKLLILSNPFDGLDVESRKILATFFTQIVKKQLSKDTNFSTMCEDVVDYPHIILAMDRYFEIPNDITNVLEFDHKKISFCGTKAEYEETLKNREKTISHIKAKENKNFTKEASSLISQSFETKNDISLQNFNKIEENKKNQTPLVEMKNVHVQWDDNVVLNNLNWTLNKGEHYLIRGPNGCGKTTFLELITGDNMQVYCNDVFIFGKKRGTGETVWDIKAKLGIVSYRLHVEYRMLGGTSLESVIISGLHDSIGLYEKKTDTEVFTAKKWLALGGFLEKKDCSFGSLSYGEQRAILILRAAVKCPEILILDEPCHGLDDENRQKILNLLEIIAESGTTTLLHVTHDMSEMLPCEKNILEFYPEQNHSYKIIRK